MRWLTTIFILLLSVMAYAETADKIIVSKTNKMLYLQKNNKVFASYPVVLGGNPVGHKEQEGDQKTPEGEYIIDLKNADSAYFKALHISYPNDQDKAYAKTKGISPGGNIMIHGQRNGLGWLYFVSQYFNWTQGCIALSNEDMQKVWQSVNAGTKIVINK